MDAWWTAQESGKVFGMLGGMIGLLGASIGLMLGVFSRKGKFRGLLLGLELLLMAVGVLSLAAGIVALVRSQPYAVWYPLLLIGLLLAALSPVMLWVTRVRYANVEARKLAAEQLRRG